MLKARLIEAEDGEQIVVFPPGFEIVADEVHLTKDGSRVVITPVAPEDHKDRDT